MQSALRVRFLLLIARYACAHISFTSPNPPPDADEQAKYEVDGERRIGESLTSFSIMYAINSAKYCVYTINTFELLAVLATALDRPALLGAESPRLYNSETGFAVVLGTLLMVFGTTVRALAYRWLGRHFTFQLAIKQDHKLVRDGPYSVVRHPGYAGGCVNLIGIYVCLLGPGSVATDLRLWDGLWGFTFGFWLMVSISLLFVLTLWRVGWEDKVLRETFEDEWVVWSKETPCRLIPYVY